MRQIKLKDVDQRGKQDVLHSTSNGGSGPKKIRKSFFITFIFSFFNSQPDRNASESHALHDRGLGIKTPLKVFKEG